MHAWMNACMHLLSTSSSKSAPGPSVFLTFFFWWPTTRWWWWWWWWWWLWQFFKLFMWNRSLATVSCTFCRPHRPKVLRAPQFLTCSSGNRAIATVLCTFCWQLSPIDPRNRGNRDPPLATTEATLPGKNTGFRARMFSSLNSRVPDLLHFPTTWRLLDDDAVDMLMVRKLAITIVCNSEVSYLNFLW